VKQQPAYWAPGTDAPWYPIEAMQRPGVPVVVVVGERGVTPLAVIRKWRGRLWWFQVGAWGGEAYGWIPREEVRLAEVGRDPPSRWSPTAWRPVDAAAWRHPLPPPLDPAFGANKPPVVTPEAPEGIDPHQGSDDWPYPDVKLGLGVPASREECEARVLRAFRTQALAGGIVGHSDGSFCGDMPGEIGRQARWHCNQEREAEERRLGVAQPLEAVRSGWTPSKRDIEDWDTALGWLNGLLRLDKDIVALRASDPPWSFRQIGELKHIHRQKAKRWYDEAIDAAFQSALRMPTSIRAAAAAGNGQQATERGRG
jgi:hypothetical protein